MMHSVPVTAPPAAVQVAALIGVVHGVVGPGCGAGWVPTGQMGLATPEQSSEVPPLTPATVPHVPDVMFTADPVVMS
jgi:hypothetical protein